MNIEQAKQISLTSFLHRLGYEPVSEKGGQFWYLSPLRHEGAPSFKVNPTLNAWYDFGEGKGGDIIDFVKLHQHVTTVSDALGCIRRVQGSEPLPTQVAMPLDRKEREPAIDLDRIGAVKSKALLAYLKRRGISIPLAASRVQEAHYACGGKRYFGLAFANDSGGYELRNPMFKGTIGTKDITTIPHQDTDKVAVFEGFFDYLTAITMHRGPLEHTAIILNSVAFRDRAVQMLKAWGTTQIELYRDNDTAGAALLNYVQEELPASQVIDIACRYPDHNDLNEWFMDKDRLRECS